MNKFEAAAASISDRVWVVLDQELKNDAITELQLRRAFTQALADALAEILVQSFLETQGPLHALLAADTQDAPTASTSTTE